MGHTRTFDRSSQASGGRAVLYLRVSSAGQVNTDYDPEGISIPAQRRRCVDKARELGVEIVDEYVEPGKSATAISKRPVFQKMIGRIRKDRDIDYVLVYSTSRMNRNWMENGAVLLELRQLGVTMVSATENIDDSPLGEAMTGFLAVFNGFQSRANGEDIKYKMGQKARAGGTIFRAPIGYLNATEGFDGRMVRSIAIDPVRSPYVKMAFELYATGRYSLPALRTKLTEAGLTTRPTARYPAGTPISINSLGKLLRDRYYCGVIVHDGEEFPGRHEAIVSEELFQRVQSVLFAERGAGTRRRTHNHYLKGLLWCGRCGKRLIIWPGRSKTGEQYLYYVCRGRQGHECDLPYLPVAKMEQLVTAHYVTVPIPAALRARIRSLANEALGDASALSHNLRAETERRLKELDDKEDAHLDLIGDPDWPQDKLRERLREIRRQQATLRNQLRTPTANLHDGHATLLATLDLLERPQELYVAASDDVRRVLNTAVFDKLKVDHSDDGPFVSGDELKEPFETVVTYNRRQSTLYTRQNSKNGAQTELSAVPSNLSLVDLLDSALRERSSSKPSMVELRGFEPLTFSLRTRRATNCATAPGSCSRALRRGGKR